MSKSLIQFPCDYVLLDIETTGLNYKYDDIIEISALKVRNNEITEKYTSLLKPEAPITHYKGDGWVTYYVDEYITDLTGITNEMIETAPETKCVLEQLKEFVADDVIIGHNIACFDIKFLENNFSYYINHELKNEYIDTLRLARWILKDIQHHRLVDLAEYYKINADQLHRAEKDCLVTYEIYNSLRNTAIEKYGNVDSFINYVKDSKSKLPTKLKADSIVATVDEFDIEHPFYNKCCVFTGALDKMPRKEAMLRVKNVGGIVGDNLTKKTNFLIVGELDYIKSVKEGKSRKMIKAEEYKKLGLDIEVISEEIFYSLLED